MSVSLNNAGRQLLRHHVPKGLWAILLSRNNLQKCKPDVIYYMLLAKAGISYDQVVRDKSMTSKPSINEAKGVGGHRIG